MSPLLPFWFDLVFVYFKFHEYIKYSNISEDFEMVWVVTKLNVAEWSTLKGYWLNPHMKKLYVHNFGGFSMLKIALWSFFHILTTMASKESGNERKVIK